MAWKDYSKQYYSTDKAIWNMDDEILKIIKDLKILFLRHLKDWNLEDAYWVLDTICMECDAKLKSKERKEIEDALEILEKNRGKFAYNERLKAGEFYINLRNLYIKINRLMKQHGVWFREAVDDENET
jgi:hypothetical protein